jgi:hypothetical protein
MPALTLAMSVAVIPYSRSPTLGLVAFAFNMPIQVSARPKCTEDQTDNQYLVNVLAEKHAKVVMAEVLSAIIVETTYTHMRRQLCRVLRDFCHARRQSYLDEK